MGLFNGAQKLRDEHDKELKETEMMYDAKAEELDAMTLERDKALYDYKSLKELLIELMGKKISDNYIGGK